MFVAFGVPTETVCWWGSSAEVALPFQKKKKTETDQSHIRLANVRHLKAFSNDRANSADLQFTTLQLKMGLVPIVINALHCYPVASVHAMPCTVLPGLLDTVHAMPCTVIPRLLLLLVFSTNFVQTLLRRSWHYTYVFFIFPNFKLF